RELGGCPGRPRSGLGIHLRPPAALVLAEQPSASHRERGEPKLRLLARRLAEDAQRLVRGLEHQHVPADVGEQVDGRADALRARDLDALLLELLVVEERSEALGNCATAAPDLDLT